VDGISWICLLTGLTLFDVMSAGGNACPLTVFSTTPKGVLGTCAFKSLYRFSSWPFDLNGEANRVRKKQSSAIIAADGALDGAWLDDRLV
jgi:hypothetical protein